MKKASILKLKTVVFAMSLVIHSACGQASPATPTLALTTPPTAPPTSITTPIPTNTNTAEPTSTPEIPQFSRYSSAEYENCHATAKDIFAYAEWTKEQLKAQGITVPQPDFSKFFATYGVPNVFIFYGRGGAGLQQSGKPLLAGYGFCQVELKTVYTGCQTFENQKYGLTTIALPALGQPDEINVVPVLMVTFFDESDEDRIARMDALSGAQAIIMSARNGDFSIPEIDAINYANVADIPGNIDKFGHTFDSNLIKDLIFIAYPGGAQ